jgi:hypothetical protein
MATGASSRKRALTHDASRSGKRPDYAILDQGPECSDSEHADPMAIEPDGRALLAEMKPEIIKLKTTTSSIGNLGVTIDQ